MKPVAPVTTTRPRRSTTADALRAAHGRILWYEAPRHTFRIGHSSFVNILWRPWGVRYGESSGFPSVSGTMRRHV